MAKIRGEAVFEVLKEDRSQCSFWEPYQAFMPPEFHLQRRENRLAAERYEAFSSQLEESRQAWESARDDDRRRWQSAVAKEAEERAEKDRKVERRLTTAAIFLGVVEVVSAVIAIVIAF